MRQDENRNFGVGRRPMHCLHPPIYPLLWLSFVFWDTRKKTEKHSPASFENSSQWHQNSPVKRKYWKWNNLHPFCPYIVSCLMADLYVCYFLFWFFVVLLYDAFTMGDPCIRWEKYCGKLHFGVIKSTKSWAPS